MQVVEHLRQDHHTSTPVRRLFHGLQAGVNIQEIFSDPSQYITVLTGAGISAESGIPTFRGPEGYWTIGSTNYHPQEMATYAMFRRQPDEVWKWYLYRLSVCRHAEPNTGHFTLVEMEKQLGDRFTLITQNVDNLHLRAGSSPERTFQIHGNVYFMRCINECREKLYPLQAEILPREKNQDLSKKDRKLLSCPDCGSRTRPHVLWFDECYDEHYFKYESSIRVTEKTDLLIITGTSGATTLPNLIASIVYRKVKTIIDINTEKNPFTELALNSPGGEFLKMSSSEGLARMLAIMKN
ncbi:MAG: RNA polymerase subunit sigma [Gammaproteobacteria bacterium]|nr:RNA polymerase subunit sigma [Gammaproteobacteria bacterium]